MEKSILRKQARIIRDEQDIEELKKKSKIILGKLYDLSCYKKAKNILTYVSTGSEADTRELIIKAASDKKKVYVPKVYGKKMKFHKINSLDELCPGLIGLSPLPSAHWNTFQRIPIRTSSWCYPTFILAKGRSPGFASAPHDSTPCSDSPSLRLR